MEMRSSVRLLYNFNMYRGFDIKYTFLSVPLKSLPEAEGSMVAFNNSTSDFKTLKCRYLAHSSDMNFITESTNA